MHRSTTSRPRFKSALMACAVGWTLAASPVAAQQVDPNKLLEIMVAKGLVTRVEADAMIAQASTAPAPVAQAAIPPGGVSGDTQTIPYIPQVVRDQIKDELRNELANKATTEGWARPGEVAEWTKRITLFGDIRVRGEAVRQDAAKFNSDFIQTSGNYPDFPNFQAINSGSGFNAAEGSPGYVRPPYLNSDKDRYRARIRARVGLRARIDDWITAEVRVATGADNSPVSTNQTLGGNGEFGKYAIWLDRANIRFTPTAGTDLVVGRFANPFWTSEMLFDEDLNFDGIAVHGTGKVDDRISVFGTLGAFPIFNTDFNFGSNDAGAFSSKDKYLAAAQLGAEFKATDDVSIKAAVGYFHFDGVQGEFSSPCSFRQDVCDTDATRPQFIQFGNSLFPIRNITPDTAVAPGTSPEVQYYGLASKFRVMNVRGAINYTGFGDVGVRLEGDFVKNLGFQRSQVAARTINPSSFAPSTFLPNPADPNNPIEIPGPFDGGDIGWQANLIVGSAELAARGDWNVNLGYRYLESDAVLDAFADSDFHNIGGTNAKGFIVGGSYAIGKSTALGLRLLSADAVSGPPFSTDAVQLDLTTHF